MTAWAKESARRDRIASKVAEMQAIASDPEAAAMIDDIRHHAEAIEAAMRMLHGGWWRVHIDHRIHIVMIVRHGE